MSWIAFEKVKRVHSCFKNQWRKLRPPSNLFQIAPISRVAIHLPFLLGLQMKLYHNYNQYKMNYILNRLRKHVQLRA